MHSLRNFSIKKFLIVAVLLLSVPVAVILVMGPTSFFNRAFGKPANLVIDTGSSFAVPGQVWRNLAQGGEEKGQMLSSVIDKTKSLKPLYIRIDHIYDAYDVVGRDGSGNLTFNWSNLDATIKDITATGAKPFISISYMSPTIAKGGNTLEVPNSWSDWELVVQRTIEHISGTGGLNISGVYYEVWNEPDLFGGYKTYGSKNYLDLYSHSAAGAARARGVNSFKFGGPATTSLYKNWLDSLLTFVSKNNIRLDFFSWHRYSKNLDDFQNDMNNARKWLDQYPSYANAELIVSEIGPNSENDSVYDSGFGAIHLMATSAVMEDGNVKEFVFEIKDGPGKDKYWGRWGLLTNDKFGAPEAKPRFYAIQFLNRMVGDKVNVAGEGSWIKSFAKNDGKTIRTFVVNYDPAGKHYEAVPMKFINLQTGNFIFRRINYGGAVNDLNVATTSASWQTIQEFNPNTAAIFEIIPK